MVKGGKAPSPSTITDFQGGQTYFKGEGVNAALCPSEETLPLAGRFMGSFFTILHYIHFLVPHMKS